MAYNEFVPNAFLDLGRGWVPVFVHEGEDRDSEGRLTSDGILSLYTREEWNDAAPAEYTIVGGSVRLQGQPVDGRVRYGRRTRYVRAA